MFLRAIASCIGAFGIANLLIRILFSRVDLNIWWIDLRFLPGVFANVILLVGCVALVWYGVRPPVTRRERFKLVLPIAALAIGAGINALTYFHLKFQHAISPRSPVPLSLLVCVALAAIVVQLGRTKVATSRAIRYWPIVIAMGIFALLFPLAQILCFGTTDYQRRGDVAVVFGARAYADGTPSDALGDRIVTACDLYRRGVVQKLIFSGGPGDGAIDEPHAMRAMAMKLGVPDEAIELDSNGVSTAATVANTTRLFRQRGERRVLVVSHFFHLPRIKLAYQRAGVEVYTVPSPQRRPLERLPYMLVRETAAWWVYYFRPDRA